MRLEVAGGVISGLEATATEPYKCAMFRGSNSTQFMYNALLLQTDTVLLQKAIRLRRSPKKQRLCAS